MSYVYIAPLMNKQAFKIGKSTNPAQRLGELSRYYEFDNLAISVIDCEDVINAHTTESILHRMCEHKRSLFMHDGSTEFFDYTLYTELLAAAKLLASMKGYSLTRLSIKAKLPDTSEDESVVLMRKAAHKIKSRRLSYNVTQTQLAAVTGVSRNIIMSLESGKSVGTLPFMRILKALDLDYMLADLETASTCRKRARR